MNFNEIPEKKTGDDLYAEEVNAIIEEIKSKEKSVDGKVLSSNDYTDDDKKKVDGLVGLTLTGSSDETALVGFAVPEPAKLELQFSFKNLSDGTNT